MGRTSFAVDFLDGTADFIEFARPSSGRVVLMGLDVFGTPANELVSTLLERGHRLLADTENAHSFVFPDLSVGLWRAVTPETPAEEQGRWFDAVAIGRAGYYSRPA